MKDSSFGYVPMKNGLSQDGTTITIKTGRTAAEPRTEDWLNANVDGVVLGVLSHNNSSGKYANDLTVGTSPAIISPVDTAQFTELAVSVAGGEAQREGAREAEGGHLERCRC